MKVFDFISKMLAVAPAVVAGIEAIHGEKDTATKTQMAQDALGISSEVAQVVLPQYTGQIAVANDMIASIIAGLQKLHAASKQQPPLPLST